MNNGYVRISSQATWNDNTHPEALEQSPVLELSIEMTSYTSRKAMADMLRTLANAVDEGTLHPFDPPITEREVNGIWDDETKQWIIDVD